MMPPPIISIIIPVYNAEIYLDSCLNSATQQTLKKIEIICVDDASTDTSRDILSRFAGNDTRVKIIKHDKNKGEGASRNTGLDNARGEYVFHLDADDTIPLDALEKLYTEAYNHGSDMVKGRFNIVHESGEIQYLNWSTPNEKVLNTNIQKSAFLQKIPTSHCTYIYKRQFLNQHNIRYRTDLIIGLDLVVLTTALCLASTVTLIPEIVYHYYQSKTSVIRGKLSIEIAKDAIRTKRITADILNAKGLHEAAALRLQSWNFIITTYWQRMPSSLTPEQCSQVFSDFRALITENNIVPWSTNTPHHHKYILALALAGQDSKVLSFLRTKESSEGFSDQNQLEKSLNFVLKQVPDGYRYTSGIRTHTNE
jgi:glycosyltransferase involved in cell wall biosynthesis